MSNIFGFIINPMELGLIWLAVAVGSAGIGIILFTIFVRLILSPLQIVQLRNAKAMQRLQPMIAELKQKHGKDRQALSQATMGLYKEHKVNPAMGCLPTLLQFPILIGLFYALMHLGASPVGYPHPTHADWVKSSCGHAVHNIGQWLHYCYATNHNVGNIQHVFNLFHANFLWLSNGLGGHDPLYILPLLAGLSQWVQSRMMLTRTTDPQQQMMNTMMNFMPLMIIVFAIRYPAGLALYWVTSTLIGIAIQSRITGFGLLPRPAQFVEGLRARTAPQPAPRPAPKQLRPAKPAPPVETELNGHDGTVAENGQVVSAPNRQRRKANRARGGRGGGRRG